MESIEKLYDLLMEFDCHFTKETTLGIIEDEIIGNGKDISIENIIEILEEDRQSWNF